MAKYKTIFAESGGESEKQLNEAAEQGYKPILMSSCADEECAWDSIILVKEVQHEAQ